MNHVNRKEKCVWNLQFCSLIHYLRRKRCSAENTRYKLKKCELDCFSPFEHANTNNGNILPLQLTLLLELHQHRSRKIISLYLEASLERLAIKRKLGFQQVVITLFENTPFTDTWPTSLRSNRIEHLTVLQ